MSIEFGMRHRHLTVPDIELVDAGQSSKIESVCEEQIYLATCPNKKSLREKARGHFVEQGR